MTRRLVVVTAGLGRPSSARLLADRIAAATTAAVTARGEAVETAVVEVREIAGDLVAMLTTGGLPTPALSRVRDLVSAADGLIAVTPVFSASYSGLFKMFVDALDPDAVPGLPVLVAATGGTARHSLMLDHAMRPLFTYLRAVVVPTGVYAATEDFGGAGAPGLTARIARAADELAALIVTQAGSAVGGFAPTERDRRVRTSGTDLPAEVTPFETLLRGHAG